MMKENSAAVLVYYNNASAVRLPIIKRMIENDYVLRHEIGSGSTGFVRQCISKTNGAVFACKTLIKGQETIDGNKFHREVEIMQHLGGHPGIVRLEAAYEDSKYFHLVMELVSGGDLLDQLVDRWSEARSARAIHELMVILRYCHEMGVLHRDIKPENILLTSSGSFKLADFGLATWFSNGENLSDDVGTAAYLAPEVLAGNYSEKVDVWSAGILLHYMLLGRLPYEENSESKILKAVKQASLVFDGEGWESISSPARDLIRKMLTTDVSARLSAEEVLRHSWILKYTEQRFEDEDQAEISSSSGHIGSIPAGRPDGTDACCATLSMYCTIEDSLLIDHYTIRASEQTLGRILCPSSSIQLCSVKASNPCKAF